jgi:hypothetical protein
LHIGLLEIGGGYFNINGLCLYTKFGFVINKNLSGRYSNCFIRDNIAMIKRFKSDETVTSGDTIDEIINDIYDIETEKEKILQLSLKYLTAKYSSNFSWLVGDGTR